MRKVCRRAILGVVLFGALGVAICPAAAEDVLELVSGAKVAGRLVERSDQSVKFEARIGSRSVTTTYPLSRIKAIVRDGEREELAASAAPGSPPAGAPGSAASPSPSAPRPGRPGNDSGGLPPGVPPRTEAEVRALIAQAGRTPPDWFESTPMNWPRSLDLSWPDKTNPWNNQVNPGQYIWDVINPNPGKWREGVRLLHEIIRINGNNPAVLERAAVGLARLYQMSLEDHARAAFWWEQRQRRSGLTPSEAANLAECYWRLGNRDMAVEFLNRTPDSFASTKLWADMGETPKALAVAEANARTTNTADAWLLAGNICRVAGDFQKALAYFQKAAAVPQDQRNARAIRLAKEAANAIQLYELSDVSRVADGRYQGRSLGYEGPIVVEVAVRNKRIESVRVTQHSEKQFYSSIGDTTQRIVQKQGVKGIDATSGATITSEAIINAAAKALASGAR